MTYETIEQQWTRVSANVIADDVDAETLDKLRTLFYSGCFSLWTQFIQVARKNDQPLFEEACAAWERELAEFPQWVKDRAREDAARRMQGKH